MAIQQCIRCGGLGYVKKFIKVFAKNFVEDIIDCPMCYGKRYIGRDE